MAGKVSHIYSTKIAEEFEHFKQQLAPVPLGSVQEELMRRCFFAGWTYANIGIYNNRTAPDQFSANIQFSAMNKEIESFWTEVMENDEITNLLTEISNEFDGEPT